VYLSELVFKIIVNIIIFNHHSENERKSELKLFIKSKTTMVRVHMQAVLKLAATIIKLGWQCQLQSTCIASFKNLLHLETLGGRSPRLQLSQFKYEKKKEKKRGKIKEQNIMIMSCFILK